MIKKTILVLFICLSNGWLFANHWTPDDAMYEDNMTITGVIQINGVEQQSTTFEVGVFCGEECRGSGFPTYFPPTQRYVVQLIVFGEAGDSLTFKLYDCTLGQELDLVSQSVVTFTSDGNGSLSNPYVIDFVGSVLPYYSITATANPVDGGTIEGTGSYAEGQTCTLVAMANEGYTFANWTEEGNVVSTNATYVFSATSNRALEANFIDSGSYYWIPNESGYEDNMTLTCLIQINGIEQQSTTLEVGVFCGEECRGSGRPTYFFPTQQYVIQLLVFGEPGDQLTFKLYDHVLMQELDLTSPEPVIFTANGYGSLQEPYVLNFTESIPQTIALSQGWNWCSFNVEITLGDLQAALVAALGTNASITIKSQTQNCKLTRGVWTGQLTMLDLSRMYNISVSADCEIALEGMPVNPAEHPVTINSGANWIAFPLSESITVTEVFGAFGINGDVIKSQLLNCRNTRGVWTGQLNTLEPGKGYIYNSASANTRTFTFPANAK